ncbi:hypothetical protein AQUCO_00901092v1 [Aquilegia coerulea]|uniref:Uncharacterized protein n=1 Tax=Aquilegia coerulea TaxID=218851 RepID=A0A2G5EGR7_AQUCA|nr:hypothetical protein AQUCO_00901092v1 [Aquilegia coerulea]
MFPSFSFSHCYIVSLDPDPYIPVYQTSLKIGVAHLHQMKNNSCSAKVGTMNTIQRSNYFRWKDPPTMLY